MENQHVQNYSRTWLLSHFSQEYRVPKLSVKMGSLNLKPSYFKVSRWVRDFNPMNQKQTNGQVWLRLYNLPMQYRGTANLWNIARSTGMPLKIDLLSLKKLDPSLEFWWTLIVLVNYWKWFSCKENQMDLSSTLNCFMNSFLIIAMPAHTWPQEGKM